MNEHSDILFATTNKANRSTPLAHLATQAVSMGYDVWLLWYYNYQLGVDQAMGPGYLPEAQIQKMKDECILHTVELAIKCFGLIAAGICSLEERKAVWDYGRF